MLGLNVDGCMRDRTEDYDESVLLGARAIDAKCNTRPTRSTPHTINRQFCICNIFSRRASMISRNDWQPGTQARGATIDMPSILLLHVWMAEVITDHHTTRDMHHSRRADIVN